MRPPRSDDGGRAPSERGAGTVLAVTLLAVLLLVGSALSVVVAMVRAHRMAESAADLAALAAASAVGRGADPCSAAARIAAANGGSLATCRPSGREVEVVVEVPGPQWLGQTADLTARARAGPG